MRTDIALDSLTGLVDKNVLRTCNTEGHRDLEGQIADPQVFETTPYLTNGNPSSKASTKTPL